MYMKKLVLGIHQGHDANAALVSENKIIAAAQEERFTRKKHYYGFPGESIKFVLRQANLAPEKVKFIANPHASGRSLTEESPPLDFIANLFKSGIRNHQRIFTLDHHLAHAACAYRCSGWRKATVVTLDGTGNGLSGTVYYGCNGRLDKISEIPTRGSLGWFYSAVTEALGFRPNDEEGKTMSLAAYGRPNPKVIEELRIYAPRIMGLGLSRDLPWIVSGTPVDDFYECHFKDSRGIRKLITKYGKEDIAASCQKILENTVRDLIRAAINKTGCGDLAVAGGIFFNVKLNSVLEKMPCVNEIRPHPGAGDCGLALGSALEAASMISKKKVVFNLNNVYLGPGFSNLDVKAALKGRKLKVRAVPFRKIPRIVSDYLQKGLAVGWFQGRMEYGPRALGNRSVLLDPRHTKAKERLNLKLKKREWFMPFAPSILIEHMDQCVAACKSPNSFFMLKTFYALKKKLRNIEACVHVDGTVRAQTLSREHNPLYYDAIRQFYNDTGVPAILNTSFNRHGLPMVCTPKDAIGHLEDHCVDILIINNMIIEHRT